MYFQHLIKQASKMESIVNGLNPNFSLDFLNTIRKIDSKNISLRFYYCRINTFMWKLKSVPSKDRHPFKVVHRNNVQIKTRGKSEAYQDVHAVIVTSGCTLEIFDDDNGNKNRYQGSKSLKNDIDLDGVEGIGHNKNTHFLCTCDSMRRVSKQQIFRSQSDLSLIG